ncbi:MAG: class I SAM-dependent methyltransferase [bacterium]|nr:class I SAM-dependent methyltransferase [bacterium]
MAEKRIEIVKQYYEDSYKEKGLNAQRLYPNEELLRFFGREFFSKIDRNKRGHIKVLELGCGSCSNLWMVSKEGFDSYGLDLSEEAVNLGQEMLSYWGMQRKFRSWQHGKSSL